MKWPMCVLISVFVLVVCGGSLVFSFGVGHSKSQLANVVGREAPVLVGSSLVPDPGTNIAVLLSSDILPYRQALSGFKAALSSSVAFHEFNMKGRIEEGRNMAKKIQAMETDLILAVGLKAALAAKLEVLDLPVVFCMVLDIGNNDLVAPNMSGVMLQIPIRQQLTMMRRVLPGVQRVGVLYNPAASSSLVNKARREVKRLGLEIIAQVTSSKRDVPQALRSLISAIDVLWLIPDRTVLNQHSLRFLLETALDSNVPVYGYDLEFVKSGALLGLYVNYKETGQQAGRLAKKILDRQYHLLGTLYQPEYPRLALNLKIAQFLGISIAPQLINQSDVTY